MAIEYVEIRDSNTDIIGIIDDASSVIWHSVCFGVGDFEIYAEATIKNIMLLMLDGVYVTRTDNEEVGIIEQYRFENSEENGKMIVASGRFAKSILDRRLIYKLLGNTNTATTLRGNVEQNVRQVVSDNAISCTFDSRRNISILELGASSNITDIIVDENGYAAQKQVSYENLLTYTDSVLEEYGLFSRLILDRERRKFRYIVYKGTDRSIDNTSGSMPIIFSQEYDNLVSSDYSYDSTPEKNVALIGGEGEGVERFYSLLAGTESDLQRREVWVDASSINRKYKDESEVEHTYTDAEYKGLLNAKGKQTLTPLVAAETLEGEIDITNGNFVYNRDFFLGDIVTVQDNDLNKYINVRIREATEYQDKDGYSVDVKYQ